MGHRSYSVTDHAEAPVEAVWDILADHEGTPSWTRVQSAGITSAGTPDRNGMGAVREFKVGPIKIVEEIIEFDPPHRMSYKALSGVPTNNYVGHIELRSDQSGGTYIEWSVEFDDKFPGPLGLGAALLTKKSITDLAKGLARAAQPPRG